MCKGTLINVFILYGICPLKVTDGGVNFQGFLKKRLLLLKFVKCVVMWQIKFDARKGVRIRAEPEQMNHILSCSNFFFAPKVPFILFQRTIEKFFSLFFFALTGALRVTICYCISSIRVHF